MSEVLLDRLPANVDAERAILGGVLLDNLLYGEAAARLRPDDFTLESHRRIFRRMTDLGESSRAIDLLTLMEELGRERELEKVGGATYISSLTDGVPRRPSLEAYIDIVRDKSRRRQLIAHAEKTMHQAMAPEETTDDLVAMAQQGILELGDAGRGRGPQLMADIVQESFGGVDGMCERGQRITGVPTFYDAFDELTAGLQAQDLVVLAARPSMGKTAFALDVLTNVTVKGSGVGLVFSLEMSRESLIGRIVCAQARVDSHRFRRGLHTEQERERVRRAFERMRDAAMFIDDTAAIGLPEMRIRARRIQMQHGRLDLVVVDYLQLMTPPLSAEGGHGNREQEVSAISRGLKTLAKELGCPVLALSQLSRAPELRKGRDKAPQLSDLRDSGAIEQDADVVCSLFRPEVYEKSDSAAKDEMRGKAELEILKQRNGPIGKVHLAFLDWCAHFETRAGEDEREPGEDG